MKAKLKTEQTLQGLFQRVISLPIPSPGPGHDSFISSEKELLESLLQSATGLREVKCSAQDVQLLYFKLARILKPTPPPLPPGGASRQNRLSPTGEPASPKPNEATGRTDALLAMECNFLRLIAELAKDEENRVALSVHPAEQPVPNAPTSLIHVLLAYNSKVLSISFDSHPNTSNQILRALGNLCYDNDEARDAIISYGQEGVLSLLRYISPKGSSSTSSGASAYSNPEILKTLIGTLLNLTMEHEGAQIMLLDNAAFNLLHKVLTRLIKYSSSLTSIKPLSAHSSYKPPIALDSDVFPLNVLPSIIVLISNLFETEQAVQQDLGIFLSECIEALAQAASTSLTCSVLEALVNLLDGILEFPTVQRSIVHVRLFPTLLKSVESLYQLCVKETEVRAKLDEICCIAAKCSMLVTMNDENMQELCNPSLMPTFKRWMKWTEDKVTHTAADLVSNTDIPMNGALCIGNLARTDATCVALVQKYDVHTDLLNLLQTEAQKLKSLGSDEVEMSTEKGALKCTVKIMHGALGAIKNLCFENSNREILRTAIPVIAEILSSDQVKLLHPICIAILKNLTSGPYSKNSYTIITGNASSSTELSDPKAAGTIASLRRQGGRSQTPLEIVISRIWKCSGENDSAIRNEGGRLLTAIIKNCHHFQAYEFMAYCLDLKCIPLIVQVISGAVIYSVATGQKINYDAPDIDAQTFPIIQYDGILSLILIGSTFPTRIPEITCFHVSLVPSLLGLLNCEQSDNATTAMFQRKCVVHICVLFKLLIGLDEKFRKLVLPDLRQSLEMMGEEMTEENDDLKTAVQELLSSLVKNPSSAN